MSKHTYTQHVQTWMLDQDYKPLALVRVVDLSLEYHELDECSFTGNILVSSEAYNHLSETDERFILYLRDNIPGAVFCIERNERSFAMNPQTGRMERAVKVAGRGNCSFFLWTCDIQPDPANDETAGQTWSGFKDDVIKAFIRYSAEPGTAYDDPDGNPRGIAGLTVAADKTEHPDGVTDYYLKGNLWDALYNLCNRDNWDVDMVWTPAWNGPDAAVTFGLETYYQGRGTDKTEDAADPVILSDLFRAIPKGDSYRDAYKYATHGYNALGHAVVARAGVTTRTRRELRFDYLSDEKVAIAMATADEEQGDTWEFIEGDAYELGQGQQQLWVGDQFTRFVDTIRTTPKDVRCTGVILEYDNDPVGTESIKIILDDPKPKQQTKGGKHRPEIEGPDLFYYWGLRDDADAVAIPRAADNTIQITGTNGITVLRTAAGQLTVDGASVVISNLHALGDTGAGAVPDGSAQLTWHGATPGYSFDAHDNQVDLTGPWTRVTPVGDAEYVRPTTFGDGVQVWDDGQGLALNITGDGDIFGNVQAIGTPFRIISLSDYDMVWADHDTTKAGIHDITFSGNLISQIDTTASRFEMLGGSDGEDAVKIRNWSVYSDTGGTTLRAQYNITNGLRLLDTDGSTPVFTVAPSTGNTVWKAGATWTIHDDVYTPPTALPAANGYRLASTTAGVMSWATPGLADIGVGTAQWQVPVTGASPFAPVWTLLSAAPGAAQKPLMSNSSGGLQLVKLEIVDTASYIAEDSVNYLKVNGSSFVDLAVGGTTQVRLQDGILFSIVNVDVALGTTSYRYNGVFSNTGNFSDDVTIGTAGKGLIFSDVTAGKLLVGDGTRYVPKTPSLTGHTDNWSVYGAVSYNNPIVNDSNQPLYYDGSGNVTTSSSGTTPIRMRTQPHYHNLVGGDGNSGITFS